MGDNTALSAAKDAKDDEFYTQYSDIEREMNAYVEYNPDVFRNKTILLPCDDPEWSEFTRYFASNFSRLGLKKLISTSYAKSSGSKQLTMFEKLAPAYDPSKHSGHGKIYVLEKDVNGDGRIDVNDIELRGYLKGDGDFRSKEVTKLRDEADIIITNPPFSLFREFVAWILDGDKDFAIIGNQNIVSYKEIFKLLCNRDIWLGSYSGDMAFKVPADSPPRKLRYWVDNTGQAWRSMGNAAWLTNLDFSQRHSPLRLETMKNNLRYNTKLKKDLMKRYGIEDRYPKYDNYDAIEVPMYPAIPSDYEGVMGVPITSLSKLSPEQFKLIGITDRQNTSGLRTKKYTPEDSPKYNDLNARGVVMTENGLIAVYPRILIKYNTESR